MLRSRFWLQNEDFGASVGATCIIFRDLSVPTGPGGSGEGGGRLQSTHRALTWYCILPVVTEHFLLVVSSMHLLRIHKEGVVGALRARIFLAPLLNASSCIILTSGYIWHSVRGWSESSSLLPRLRFVWQLGLRTRHSTKVGSDEDMARIKENLRNDNTVDNALVNV